MITNIEINTTGFAMDRGKQENLILQQKPNIYFILADGYSSPAYFDDQNLDVSELMGYLQTNNFRTYDDTFSNYHPTTHALAAILNMEHHHYKISGHQFNFSEVSRSSRAIIGGDNRLNRILKSNGYTTQYIHQGTYLLLQGCTADYCFPEMSGFGLENAMIILSRIFAADLMTDDLKHKWVTSTKSDLMEKSLELLDNDETEPRFQYIHIYGPGHASNNLVGKCNGDEEIAKYYEKVKNVNKYLKSFINNILKKDPAAVIILAGDHGPFISNKCSRNSNLYTPEEYRDRAGALISIRWPTAYSGEYDSQIRTTINIFYYVLASLMGEGGKALENKVIADDVFIRGDARQVYKIVSDGELLKEAEVFKNH